MTSIPSPIRKWVERYITGEGSGEIADQSPVQSVNSQTGDVTISTGGGVIPSSQTVTSYPDLPLADLSEAEIWFVTGESDIVASTQLSPVVWRSLSDFTTVAADIPDSVISRDTDTNSASTVTELGIEVSVDVDFAEFQAEISANTADATTAYIDELDNNDNIVQNIATVDISGKSAGDIVTFAESDLSEPLSAGTSYSLSADASSSNYTVGFTADNGPYVSSDGNITIEGGTSENETPITNVNNLHNFVTVGNINLS